MWSGVTKNANKFSVISDVDNFVVDDENYNTIWEKLILVFFFWNTLKTQWPEIKWEIFIFNFFTLIFRLFLLHAFGFWWHRRLYSMIADNRWHSFAHVVLFFEQTYFLFHRCRSAWLSCTCGLWRIPCMLEVNLFYWSLFWMLGGTPVLWKGLVMYWLVMPYRFLLKK